MALPVMLLNINSLLSCSLMSRVFGRFGLLRTTDVLPTSSNRVLHSDDICKDNLPRRTDVRNIILSILEFGKSFGIPKVLEFHGIPMEYQSPNMKYL